MSSIGERLAKLRIKSVSPDRTVRATFDGETGLRIHLRTDDLPAANEKHVSVQMTHALRGVLDGWVSARAELRADDPQPSQWGRGGSEGDDDDANDSVESPSGQVRVDWHGHSDVTVSIRPRAFSRLDAASLVAEVNGCVDAVMVKQLHRTLDADARENGPINSEGILT